MPPVEPEQIGNGTLNHSIKMAKQEFLVYSFRELTFEGAGNDKYGHL